MVKKKNNSKTPEKEEQKRLGSKTLLIGSVVIFILAIASVTIKVPYNAITAEMVKEPYEATETYTEKEPYTTTETYYVKEPYTTTKCEDVKLKYNIKWSDTLHTCIDTECSEYEQVCVEWNWLHTSCKRYENQCVRTGCTKYRKTCSIIINNIDDTGGTWKLDAYVVDENGNEHYVGKESTYIQPQTSGTISWTYIVYPGDFMRCNWKSLEVPTKKVCEKVTEYRSVPETRTVIKYRDVEKKRTLTKFKDVEKEKTVVKYETLLEAITGAHSWEKR